MECNKDDAIKAKVISERKLTEKDFAGAKKFARKAQVLYPALEGLTQLMMTIVVYESAEKKVSGEIDWYRILGVNPTADDETVRKQYRKLALMLHPDKNKCVGADGAFKLLSEAWSLLSDKAKRLAYNKKRSSNGFHNFTSRSSSNVRPPNIVPPANPASIPRPSVQRSNSFWTKCETCKMYYEYLRIYHNQTLRCTRCHQSFKAVEMAPPPNYSKPPDPTLRQRHQKPAPPSNNLKPPNSFPQQSNNMPPHHAHVRNPVTAPGTGLGGSSAAKFQHASFGGTASVGPTVSSPSVVAKAANVVHQANEKMKRVREEAHGVSGWEKRRGLVGNFNGYVGNTGPQMATASKAYDFAGVKHVHMSTRELTPFETRKMLIKKAKTEILSKLSQLSSESLTKAADSKKVKVSDVKRKSFVKADNCKRNKNGVIDSVTGGDKAKKSSSKTATDADNNDAEINVPDPDFYEFDQDRTESSFGENQVWAAFDDDDGMPRFYAMVHKVISLKPFKMRISWLEYKTNGESGDMNWVGSGFYKSCGEFTVGKPEFSKSLNSFSHKVEWVRGSTGSICILPKKGQVWALYRNWSPDWNELIPDEVVHQYDMVEVLEDYNEDQGLSVAPLIKVSGFRTVFRTCSAPEYVQRIPKEEMLRFSHQVPNHLLTGEEAKDAPKGFQELDPASTPLEFIQVDTEKEMVGMEKKINEHITESIEEGKIGMMRDINN